MGFLRIEQIDATLRWLDMGSGRPLVVLAGISMPVLPGFAAVAADPALSGRRRILLDCAGAGQSDHPGRFDYSLDSHAAVVAAVLDHLGCGPADFLGHSMGGSIAIRLAAIRPDLVSRLVVAESNLFPGGGVMSSRIAGLGRAAFLRSEYADLLEELRDKARSGVGWADRLWSGWRIADPNGLFANAEGLVNLSDDFYDTFRSLPVPKTFVYGERNFGAGAPDTPDPERLKADGIAVSVIPGAGHAMMLDNHAAFVQALSTALAEGS